MNVRLLRRIQKVILEEPKRMAMERWVSNADLLPKSKRPACGTVACIGGWAVAISQKLKGADLLLNYWGIEWEADKALQLDEDSGYRLMDPDEWPDHFRDELDRCNPGTERYARVVSARIDHFIATKGAE